MTRPDSGDSQVVLQFREFYRRVIELKHAAGITQALPGETNVPAHPTTVDGIRASLVTLLEEQQRVAARIGGDYIIVYDDARYVMAALADEIFLHSEWHGRRAWNDNLIETRFYGTHVAGDLFFQRLERLLVSPREGMNLELAKIYLLALSLGFQGRYRGADPTRECERYRERLHAFIYGDARRLSSASAAIFTRAYEHTLSLGETRMLPPVRRWLVRFTIVLVLALGVQHVVWRLALTQDLWTIIREIMSMQTI